MRRARAIFLLIGILLTGPVAGAPLRDRCGDPLPAGAVARLGTVRFRDPPPPVPESCLDDEHGRARSADGLHDAGIVDGRVELHRSGHAIPLRPRRGWSEATCLAFSPDGRRLALGRASGAILLVETATGQVRRTLVGHDDTVRMLRFDDTGARLVSAADDRSLRVWDVASGEERRRIRLPDDAAEALAVEGDTIRAWGDVGHARWGLDSGESLDRDTGHRSPVRHVAVSADGRLAASTSGAPVYHLWNVETGRWIGRDDTHVGRVTGLAFAPTGDLIASTGDRGAVRLRSVETGRSMRVRSRSYMRAYRAAFAPDGWLVTGGIWGALQVWDSGSGDLLGVVTAHDHRNEEWETCRVAALAVSPDGRTVASAAHDETIEVHDLETGRLLGRRECGGLVATLSFTRDGRRLVAVDEGASVALDLPGLEERARLSGTFLAARCSPDGVHLATGDADGRLRIHEASSLAVLATIDAHAGAIRDLAFSADGRRLVTASDDATLLVWDLAAVLGPAVSGLEEGESFRPYGGCLPGAEPPGVEAILVLDGTTGRPLAGAQVLRCAEEEGGPPGRILSRAITDRHGLARILGPEEEGDDQWVIDAPGFAARSALRHGLPPRTVLFPGRKVEGRLLGPLGEPRRGVEIELFLGCGHSPAVARAMTDAHGVFTLPHVNPAAGGLLWWQAPGLLSEYVEAWPLWSRGEGRAVFVARPGRTFAGRILEADGAPAAGVFLRARNTYRGPWAKAAADGRFTLHGLDPREGVWLLDPASWVTFAGEVPGPPWFAPDARRTLVRPPTGLEFEDVESRRAVDFSLRVVDAETGAPVACPSVLFLHEATGRRYEAEAFEDETPGRLDVELPEGAYRVAVGGPFAAFASEPVTVTVRRDLWPPLVLKARRQPVLALEIEGLRDDDSLRLVTAVADRDLDPDLAPDLDESVSLPADGLCVIHVERDRARGHRRIVPVGPAENGVRRAVGRVPGPHRIVVPGLPEDPSLEADLPVLSGDAPWDEPGVFETLAAGRVRFRFSDEERGIADLAVDLPEKPGATVVAPELVWRPVEETAPRLLLADGRPTGGTLVGVGSDDDFIGNPFDDRESDFDVDVVSTGDGVPPDRSPFESILFEARAPGLVPVTFPHRPGRVPEYRGGTGTSELTVTDETGAPVAFVLAMGGSLLEATGHLDLGGIARGPHILVVAARNRAAVEVDLDLEAGARRHLEIALPALPAR